MASMQILQSMMFKDVIVSLVLSDWGLIMNVSKITESPLNQMISYKANPRNLISRLL